MRSIFRFMLVLAIAILMGLGIYYAGRTADHVLSSAGLITNNRSEPRPANIQPNQIQNNSAPAENNPNEQPPSLYRRLRSGIKGMGVHFVFFAIIVFMVILARKSIGKIPLPKPKRI